MNDETDNTVEFHYIKGKDFRTVLAEGVVGSINPSGRIVCAFYHERSAIPQLQKFSTNSDGDLLKQVSAEGKSGFVRELEIAVSLDIASAKSLRKFLAKLIQQLEEIDKKEPKKVIPKQTGRGNVQ